MTNLEEIIESRFNGLRVIEKNRICIRNCLEAIREKHEDTYLHCARVGLLSDGIAQHMGLRRETLFSAGLVHDVGKIMFDASLLSKTHGFDADDREEIRKHAIYGHFLLCNEMPYIAEIVLRHHRFGKHPYPSPLPKTGYIFKGAEKIEALKYAMIVGIADCYDAMMTRQNDHECSYITGWEEKKEFLIAQNKKLKPLILELCEKGILGREIK